MNAVGAVLFNSSFIGSSAGAAIQWQGGRTSFAIVAQAYGTGVFLQQLLPDNQTWIANSGAIGAIAQNLVVELSLPRGQYRLISNASSSIGVNAVFVTVPYN